MAETVRFVEEDALGAVWNQINVLLREFGVMLDGFYYCPHHPEGIVAEHAIGCDCRKPAPGLIHKAAREHGGDLKRSWFIGDILNDVEAAHRAGCRAVLIDNGNETEWKRSPLRWSELVSADMAEAARLITRDHEAASHSRATMIT